MGRSCVLWLLLMAGMEIAACAGETAMQNQHDDEVALQVAHDYVVHVKKWKTDQFRLEVTAHKPNNIVTVDAVHVDDLRGEKGVNKSIQIQVDVVKRIVTNELAFQ